MPRPEEPARRHIEPMLESAEILDDLQAALEQFREPAAEAGEAEE